MAPVFLGSFVLSGQGQHQIGERGQNALRVGVEVTHHDDAGRRIRQEQRVRPDRENVVRCFSPWFGGFSSAKLGGQVAGKNMQRGAVM